MKSVSPKKYARALYELIGEARSEAQLRQLFRNFLTVVAANRDTAKLQAIVAALAQHYDEVSGTMRGTLVTARELDTAAIDMIQQNVAALIGAQTTVLERRVDESIVGGFKAVFTDRIVDASVKGQINRLKQELMH